MVKEIPQGSFEDWGLNEMEKEVLIFFSNSVLNFIKVIEVTLVNEIK